MARIRSTKPEFWLDRKLARSCSRDARMLYMGLWNQADEHGRMHGDAAVLKGAIFPYDDDLTLNHIETLLDELSVGGWVRVYEYEDDPYIFLPKLHKHQRLEPAKAKSRFPEPPEHPEPPPNGHKRRPDEHSEKIVAESAQTVAASGTSVASLWSMEHVAGSMEHGCAAAPSADMSAQPPKRAHQIPDDFAVTDAHRQWAMQKVPGVNPDEEIDHFINHHQAKGSTMKNWDAAFRTWLHNAKRFGRSGGQRSNALDEKRVRQFSVISNSSDTREIS